MLTAVTTHFDGYRFRSRLEARWGVFFKTLGVKYFYEVEGYELDGLLYLPDFYLPTINDDGAYVEIKGVGPSEEDEQKAERLATYSGKRVYLFVGNIAPDWDLVEAGDWTTLPVGECFFPDKTWDNTQYWCECRLCHRFGIEFEGCAHRICACFPDDRGHSPQSDNILRAYSAAQQARFEHGEHG